MKTLWGGTVVVGLVVYLGLPPWGIGQSNGSLPKIVEADQFILRDEAGRRRAELGFHEGVPSLAFFDPQGAVRTRVTLQKDGSSRLLLYDEKGVARDLAFVGPSGTLRTLEKTATGIATAGPAAVAPQQPIQSATAESALQEELKAIEPIYRQYCASCHSNNGQGTRVRTKMPSIPDFTAATWQNARTDTQVLVSILEGRGTDMPPFSAELTNQDARTMVRYLRVMGGATSKPAAAPAGDFETRLQELQRHWEDLDRQMRGLTSGSGGR